MPRVKDKEKYTQLTVWIREDTRQKLDEYVATQKMDMAYPQTYMDIVEAALMAYLPEPTHK